MAYTAYNVILSVRGGLTAAALNLQVGRPCHDTAAHLQSARAGPHEYIIITNVFDLCFIIK